MTHTFKIHPEAKKDMHLELSADGKELEIYIGGWYLSSVTLEDISPEAMEYVSANGKAY